MTNHTPEPWAVWRLAPDSDPEERFIVVGPDGESQLLPAKAGSLSLALRR